jgi:AcrR family transcriptional regulator
VNCGSREPPHAAPRALTASEPTAAVRSRAPDDLCDAQIVSTATRKPRRKRAYHHGDLKNALLDAAVSFLEKHDVEDLSLREIARRAGVTTGAPYHHFASKDDLIAAVATQAFAMLADALARAEDPALEPRARIHALGRAYVAFATAHPTRFRVMWRVEGADVRPDLMAAKRATYAPLARAAAAADRRERPDDEKVLALWSLIHGLTFQWIDGRVPRVFPGKTASEIVARMLDHLIDGAFRSASPAR